MRNKKPPFEITSSILDKIAEIAELVGQVNAVAGLTTNPMLRRTNRKPGCDSHRSYLHQSRCRTT